MGFLVITMKWSKSEINYIRTSLHNDAQKIADELGRAKENVEIKMKELDAKERLANLCEFVRK